MCEDYLYQQVFEKVAIYANDEGLPRHIAKQLARRAPSAGSSCAIPRDLNL